MARDLSSLYNRATQPPHFMLHSKQASKQASNEEEERRKEKKKKEEKKSQATCVISILFSQ